MTPWPRLAPARRSGVGVLTGPTTGPTVSKGPQTSSPPNHRPAPGLLGSER